MADNREAFVKYGYDVDQQSLSQVKAADDAVIAGLQRIGGEATKTSATFDRLKQASATIARSTDIEAVGKQFATLGKAIGDDTAALIQMRQALKEIGASAGEVDKATRSFKEMQAASAAPAGGSGLAGLQRTGRSLTGLGLGGVGEIFNAADDLQDVTEGFKQLGESAKGLPGIFGQLSVAGAGAAGSMGALLAPMVAIALPVGALALAIGELKKRFDDGHNAVQQFLSDQAQELDFRIQANQKAKTMTADEVKARQAAIQQEIAERDKGNQTLINQDKELRRQYAETGDVLKKAAIADTLRQIGADVDKQNAIINKLFQEYKSNQQVLDPLVKAREAETAAIQGELSAIEKKVAGQQQDAQLRQGGTVKGVEDRIQALANEKKAIEDNLPALEAAAKKSKEGEAALKKYTDRLAEINQEQTNLNDNILPYLQAKESEKAFLDEATKGSEAYIKKQKEYADLIANESSAGLQKRIEDIAREKKAIQDGLPQLDALAETNEEAKQKAIDLRKRIDELNDAEAHLTGEIKAAIEAREAEAKAIEKQKAQATIIEKLEDDKATILQKAEDDKASILQKAGEAQASITQKSARDRAAIEEQYGEKLVEIARNAAEEAANALSELQQKQADLRTSLVRDEEKSSRDDADKTYDIQLKAQRAERDALQDHLARIQEIRRGDYVQDQKDLLDRNFQAIYLRKLGQNQQIEEENQKFGQGGGQRQQAVQDEIQDAQRASQIQRRERLIAFQQQQQDAQLAYQRQLAAAKQARDRELAQAAAANARALVELRKKTAQELAELQARTAKELQARQAATARELQVRQAAAVKELQLIDRTEAQKLAIITKYAKQATDMLNAALKAVPTKRAGGGYLEAGQVAMVNEAGSSGNEGFDGVAFPSGQGIFIPQHSGYVDPNRSGAGMTINIPMTIVGATDPEATARAVDDRLVMRLKQVMGK